MKIDKSTHPCVILMAHIIAGCDNANALADATGFTLNRVHYVRNQCEKYFGVDIDTNSGRRGQWAIRDFGFLSEVALEKLAEGVIQRSAANSR